MKSKSCNTYITSVSTEPRPYVDGNKNLSQWYPQYKSESCESIQSCVTNILLATAIALENTHLDI